ncbi:MAG: C69 family dipeptidase [Promethearchaeota archaeon]
MCDTYVALNTATSDNSVIFGKNSDRKISEAQLITYTPQKRHSDGEDLECTCISISQVCKTNAVILSKPFWIWGAEMGANECGVVIGNEALATREPLKEIGLIGMDLLRLGLERGKTANESLNIIIELIEKYGQGGAHFQDGANYHNSFIIADPKEAYVLEVAGDWWVVERVKEFRSISNDLSIRGQGDLRRDGIIQHAIEKNYCKDDKDFDFASTFSSIRPFPSNIKFSYHQLQEKKSKITPSLMMSFLRDHEGNICRHQRKDLTVSSQVSHIQMDNKNTIHWFTGTILTCLSIFKPYIFPIEDQTVLETKQYSEVNPDWFWKKHLDYTKPFISKPSKENHEREIYRKRLTEIENDIIMKVNVILSKENKFSKIETINKIKSLNRKAWESSEKLIN